MTDPVRPPSFLQGIAAEQIRPAPFGGAAAFEERPAFGASPSSRSRPPSGTPLRDARGAAQRLPAGGAAPAGAATSQPTPAPAPRTPAPAPPVAPAPSPPVPDFDLEAIEAEMEQMRASVAEALEALRAQAGVWRAQASEDALKVGFEVARALVGRELEQTAEPLVGVVTDALRELAEARELQVRLHPDDVVAFEAYGVHDKPVGLARVELVGDPQLGRGDVLIDSDVGSIDARLDVRLESIRKALRAAMGGGA